MVCGCVPTQAPRHQSGGLSCRTSVWFKHQAAARPRAKVWVSCLIQRSHPTRERWAPCPYHLEVAVTAPASPSP